MKRAGRSGPSNGLPLGFLDIASFPEAMWLVRVHGMSMEAFAGMNFYSPIAASKAPWGFLSISSPVCVILQFDSTRVRSSYHSGFIQQPGLKKSRCWHCSCCRVPAGVLSKADLNLSQKLRSIYASDLCYYVTSTRQNPSCLSSTTCEWRQIHG